MTHFVLLVIIPKAIYQKGNKTIHEYITKIMEKYDENLEIEIYIEKTKSELLEEFELFKNTEDYKEYNYKTVEEYAKTWKSYDLDSEGNVVSTYNKEALYDWYVIGGRWDGILTENEQFTNNGFNFNNKHHTIENNSINVEVFLEKYNNDPEKFNYSTILDKNGILYQDREYGWFGSYKKIGDEKSWKNIYERKLNDSKEDYIINLDCHT